MSFALQARIKEMEAKLTEAIALNERVQRLAVLCEELNARLKEIEEKRGPGRPKLVSNG
jgi:hypothetical protein